MSGVIEDDHSEPVAIKAEKIITKFPNDVHITVLCLNRRTGGKILNRKHAVQGRNPNIALLQPILSIVVTF